MGTTQVSYSLTQLLSVHKLHFSVSQLDILLCQHLKWAFSVVITHFLVLTNVARKVKFHFLGLMFNRKSMWIHCWKSHDSKLLTFSEVQLFFNTIAINKMLNVSLFIRSCCYIWLYKGQRRWAVVYGGCNHLCDQEERWRLVWRSLQSSNWLVSWELRWINHALCRLKSFAFQSLVLYSSHTMIIYKG